MPYIAVSADALAIIESQRDYPAPEIDPHPSRRRADGGYDIWVSDETLERLKAVAFETETLSDTIIRLATHRASGGRPG